MSSACPSSPTITMWQYDCTLIYVWILTAVWFSENHPTLHLKLNRDNSSQTFSLKLEFRVTSYHFHEDWRYMLKPFRTDFGLFQRLTGVWEQVKSLQCLRNCRISSTTVNAWLEQGFSKRTLHFHEYTLGNSMQNDPDYHQNLSRVWLPFTIASMWITVKRLNTIWIVGTKIERLVMAFSECIPFDPKFFRRGMICQRNYPANGMWQTIHFTSYHDGRSSGNNGSSRRSIGPNLPMSKV
jgi:hypothetical protein